ELGIVTYAPKTNLLKLVCVRGGTPDVTGVTEEEAPVTHAVFYPNPTTGIVTIDARVQRASLYTMDGQLVQMVESTSQFSLWEQPAGAYIIVYTTELGVSSTVIIKQ
ncbi:MAG: T9SS type A sorting domain-containing protein, partial [Ignavibacteria bacterium]